jgi:hypothetical protein
VGGSLQGRPTTWSTLVAMERAEAYVPKAWLFVPTVSSVNSQVSKLRTAVATAGPAEPPRNTSLRVEPSPAGQLVMPGGHGGWPATSLATSLTFAELVTVTGAGGFRPSAFGP